MQRAGCLYVGDTQFCKFNRVLPFCTRLVPEHSVKVSLIIVSICSQYLYVCLYSFQMH